MAAPRARAADRAAPAAGQRGEGPGRRSARRERRCPKRSSSRSRRAPTACRSSSRSWRREFWSRAANSRPSSLSGLAIPETLQDSLMARLDRLGEAKQVAQLAAAIGREFPYALLASVAPMTESGAAPGARAARGGGARLSAGTAAQGDLHVQARAGAGRGLPVAAREPAQGAPRAHRRRARGAFSRARRPRARGDGAALRAGGAHRAGDRPLPARGRARGAARRLTTRRSSICARRSICCGSCPRATSATRGRSRCA